MGQGNSEQASPVIGHPGADMDAALHRAALALCLAQFGDEAVHGDARCCQVGGTDGCCVSSLMPQVIAVASALKSDPQ